MATYIRPELLILDDFGLKPLNGTEPEDLYDVIADRYEHGSILLASNRVPAEWLDWFANPLLASAGMTACYIMPKHSSSAVPAFAPRAVNRLTRRPLQLSNCVMELVRDFIAMSRHESRSTPKIISSVLYTDDQFTGTRLDSPAWFAWLS